MIKIVLVLFLFYISQEATVRVSITSGSGFQTTTCTGCCCTNGIKTVTTPQQCSTLAGFQGYFSDCSAVTCPPATVISVSKGCTIINMTGIIDGIVQPTITTYWGYTNIANVNIILPVGVYDLFVNAMGFVIDAGQPQVFLPGIHLNSFSTTTPLSGGPLSWNVTYDGWTSLATADNFTTCEGYCCNSTYCITTNDSTCSMVTLGTVKWGGYGTNCTNGAPVSDDLPFPCPCTSSVNNGASCGTLNTIQLTQSCITNNGDGTCQVYVDSYNANTETYTFAENSFSPTLLYGTLRSTIPPGTVLKSENLTWACPAGIGGYTRNITIPQIFANY